MQDTNCNASERTVIPQLVNKQFTKAQIKENKRQTSQIKILDTFNCIPARVHKTAVKLFTPKCQKLHLVSQNQNINQNQSAKATAWLDKPNVLRIQSAV